jgi:hypothetical protein
MPSKNQHKVQNKYQIKKIFLIFNKQMLNMKSRRVIWKAMITLLKRSEFKIQTLD